MVETVTENIDVSIIIINYNSFELTNQTIETFMKFSSGFTWEIIVVDNNSIDNSGKELKKKYPNLNFILNNENIGFAKANNQGLKIAKGNYVLFLNNDIIFIENSIKIILEYLSVQSDNILIAPRLLNIDKTIQYSTYSFQSLWLSFTTYFFLYSLFPKSKYFNKYYLLNKGVDEIIETECITGAFMLFRTEPILELNGFDEDFFFYGEDNDLCLRHRKNGGVVQYFPRTEIIHVKGGTKKTNWFSEKNRALSTLKIFQKHFPLSKRFLARFLFFCGTFLRMFLLLLAGLFTLNRQNFQDAFIKIKILKIILIR